MSETLDVTHNVALSDDAVTKIKALFGQEGRDNLRLRVVVQPGGCPGLMYQLYFDECGLEGNAIHDLGGVEVIADKMSKPYPDGATIGSADGIDRRGFTINNPNATGPRACGGSFH